MILDEGSIGGTVAGLTVIDFEIKLNTRMRFQSVGRLQRQRELPRPSGRNTWAFTQVSERADRVDAAIMLRRVDPARRHLETLDYQRLARRKRWRMGLTKLVQS